jgi:hypothetical protein
VMHASILVLWGAGAGAGAVGGEGGSLVFE